MKQRVLQVPAIIDIADDQKTQWQAIAVPGTLFEGLFAFGDNFAEARKAFAAVIAESVAGGAVTVEDLEPADLAAVRVLATTRKTFSVTDLGEPV
ncbi:MAG: hypothetical protein OEY62_03240 [Acidimicrobiia bacterium]|nr:hypothetical protein [Acidimicrobiia bacterium]